MVGSFELGQRRSGKPPGEVRHDGLVRGSALHQENGLADVGCEGGIEGPLQDRRHLVREMEGALAFRSLQRPPTECGGDHLGVVRSANHTHGLVEHGVEVASGKLEVLAHGLTDCVIRRPRVAGSGWLDQDEATNALRSVSGKLEGHVGARRVPNDVGALDMKGVQERGEVVGVIGDADMTGRGRTGDIAGSADPDHANVREFGSRREGNEPVREKAGVDEHDRLAASLIAVLDFPIADSKTLHDFLPQSRPLSHQSAVIVLVWWLAVNFTTVLRRPIDPTKNGVPRGSGSLWGRHSVSCASDCLICLNAKQVGAVSKFRR